MVCAHFQSQKIRVKYMTKNSRKTISWWFCVSGSMQSVVGLLVTWPLPENKIKMKVVALHFSFKKASSQRVNDTDRQQKTTDTPQQSAYIQFLCLQLVVYLLWDSSCISISFQNPLYSSPIPLGSTIGLLWSQWDIVRFPQYLGQSWTGCGPHLHVSGAKNHTELNLQTLHTESLRQHTATKKS